MLALGERACFRERVLAYVVSSHSARVCSTRFTRVEDLVSIGSLTSCELALRVNIALHELLIVSCD